MDVRCPKPGKAPDGLVNTVNALPLRNPIPGASRMNGFASTILNGDMLNYSAGTNAIVARLLILKSMSFGRKFIWSEPSLPIHCGCFGYPHPPCPMALR
jgi:hypothetical protein